MFKTIFISKNKKSLNHFQECDKNKNAELNVVVILI